MRISKQKKRFCSDSSLTSDNPPELLSLMITPFHFCYWFYSKCIRMPPLANCRTIQNGLAIPRPGFSYPIRCCTISHYAAVVLVLLQLVAVLASFSSSDFQGPFIRRYGITLCADNLSFETSNTSISASQVYLNDEPCTNGTLGLRLATYETEVSGQLGASLSAERGVGDVYVIDVVDELKCSDRAFIDQTWFTFVKPDNNVTINWVRVFGTNDTSLQAATGGSGDFTFQSGVSYVVINSVCLYSSLSESEYDDLRGEACFPADTSVSLHDGGKKRIQKLSIGDHVAYPSNPSHSCTVIGWTHWRPFVLSSFLRFTVTSGHILTVSPRHFVHTSDGMRPARTIRVGDYLQVVSNDIVRSMSVLSIKNVRRNGLFNVQTSCGDIIADDFLCSSYTEAVPPIIAHALLLPARIATYGRFDLLAWTWLFEDTRRNAEIHGREPYMVT